MFERSWEKENIQFIGNTFKAVVKVGRFFRIIENEEVVIFFEGRVIVEGGGDKLGGTSLKLLEVQNLFFGKRKPVRNGKNAGRLTILVQRQFRVHGCKITKCYS